ncbi:hypothetical protein PRUPE_8G164500 [Prunus persica]|uniref:Uncharacterized protein n=1 Tax=Prunus persica TaxID=3760 RepID=A0A251MYV5_PRUPE|nr:hypothetical protein PRUPE_8G164500 [Prunus persica]
MCITSQVTKFNQFNQTPNWGFGINCKWFLPQDPSQMSKLAKLASASKAPQSSEEVLWYCIVEQEPDLTQYQLNQF